MRDNSVDHDKIGKINHCKNADGWQDRRQYLLDCPALLRPTGKEVYYKFCLRKFVPDVEFMPEEKDPDAYIVRANSIDDRKGCASGPINRAAGKFLGRKFL